MSAAHVVRSDETDTVPAEPISQVRIARPRGRRRVKRDVRARAIVVDRIPKRELARLRELYPAEEHAAAPRPRVRADCEGMSGPCPWVSCRYHLYLDVLPSGNIKLNFPDLEPDELPVSCVLEVADGGGVSLERAGELMNLTRERVRNLQEIALSKLATRAELVDEHGGLARSIVRLRVYPRGPELVAVPESRPFDVERFVGEDLDGD